MLYTFAVRGPWQLALTDRIHIKHLGARMGTSMKNEKITCIAAHRFQSNKKICTYSLDRNALLALIIRII